MLHRPDERSRARLDRARWKPILGRLRIWLRRSRTRDAVLHLDGHALQNVGIRQEERLQECRKWFWRD